MRSATIPAHQARGRQLARAFAVKILGGTDRGVADTAELAVSELVTNALLHAGPPVVVDLCTQLVTRLLPDNADDDVAIVALRAFREDRPRPPEAGPENVPVMCPRTPDVTRATTPRRWAL